jgi:hypothetical protein
VSGEGFLSILLNWLLRGLMVVGGAALVWQGLPVTRSAWRAQKADTVVYELRTQRPMALPDVEAAIAALDGAVAADPVAGRYLQRSELVGGAALAPDLKATPVQRRQWLHRAKADLEKGLARAPARGIDWLRLAVIHQALDGISRDVVPPLFMSIETAPLIPQIWPTRLRLILDNWVYFSDAERAQLRDYVAMTWRTSSEHVWFARAIYSPVDELLIRSFLGDDRQAQEELSQLILRIYKK